MPHENEYHDNLVTMLEIIWGKDYMAPGGPGNVARLLTGLETRGKSILDIGCGIGGPVFEMAARHGAKVTGIDLEAPLIARAQKRARELKLDDVTDFRVVEVGDLPFADGAFDIVVTSGALTQTEDKRAVFRDCHRVLVPGGVVSCYDWMRSERDYSDDMYYWFKMEGLTYALETLQSYREILDDCGFEDVTTEDASDWYRSQVKKEYELVRGELFATMVESLGREDAEYFVENWRAMVVVCDNGEMRQGYCRGRKPG